MAQKLTKEQFEKMLKEGRKFCWASLYERQDFMVEMPGKQFTPVREITNEKHNWHRQIGRK